MIKLSTGDDSTLGVYKKLCVAVFGEDSPQTKFIQTKIDACEKGENEEVIADEAQILALLGSMGAEQ